VKPLEASAFARRQYVNHLASPLFGTLPASCKTINPVLGMLDVTAGAISDEEGADGR
jgi:hypothetical protein